MPTYTEAEIVAAIMALLEHHSLSWERFLELGEAEALMEIDPDLDFAFTNLVPHLTKNPPVPA